MFANLHQIATTNNSPTSHEFSRARDIGPSLTKEAIAAPSTQEARYILAGGLVAKAISILSLASDQFNPGLSLYSYGVDSWIAVLGVNEYEPRTKGPMKDYLGSSCEAYYSVRYKRVD
ncbi:hypothetical protein F4824DRAFT_440231 [Ustulina deusta]|nr:hypothetical protein F4824DRAFT_440231 [Ustulina deusta]